MKTRSYTFLAAPILAVIFAGLTLGERAYGIAGRLDPSGTWRVTFTRDGKAQAYQPLLKLKHNGNRLNGTLSHRRGNHEIEMILNNAKLESRNISFMVIVTPETRKWAKVVRRFEGKVNYDSIKDGTVDEEWAGENPFFGHPLTWQAVRVKD